MLAKRNIPLLFVYGFLVKRFAFPVLVVYYLAQQITFTQLGILAAVVSATVLVMEIPGGIFADRYGKKSSLVLAAGFSGIYSLILVFADSFWPFVLGSVLYGFSYAFLSGTREALLFDSLKEMGKSKLFKKYTGRIRLFVQTLNAAAMAIVPLLYIQNEQLPFWIMFGFFVAAMFAAAFMHEPKITKHDEEVPLFVFHQHLGQAARQVWQSPYVLASGLLLVILTSFFTILADYIQPLLQVSGLDLLYFGLFYTVMRFIQGLAAEMAHRVEKWGSTFQILSVSILSMLVGFVMMGLGATYLIWIGILVMNIGFWIIRVTLKDELNQNIESSHRTTILSLQSFAGSIFSMMVILTFSGAADAVGLQETFVYTSVALAVLAGLGLLNMFVRFRSLK